MTLDNWGTVALGNRTVEQLGQVERRLSPAPLCAPSVEARCQADLWIAGRLLAGSGRRVPLPVTLVCYVCLGSTACTGLTAGISGAW